MAILSILSFQFQIFPEVSQPLQVTRTFQQILSTISCNIFCQDHNFLVFDAIRIISSIKATVEDNECIMYQFTNSYSHRIIAKGKSPSLSVKFSQQIPSNSVIFLFQNYTFFLCSILQTISKYVTVKGKGYGEIYGDGGKGSAPVRYVTEKTNYYYSQFINKTKSEFKILFTCKLHFLKVLMNTISLIKVPPQAVPKFSAGSVMINIGF